MLSRDHEPPRKRPKLPPAGDDVIGMISVPDAAPDCLAGVNFVITGTLESLQRHQAHTLIQQLTVRCARSAVRASEKCVRAV